MLNWVPPLRPELKDVQAYGAPQLDVPVQLNVNENPYGPDAEVVAEITKAVSEIAGTLHRYPDREFSALRVALANYLNQETGLGIDAEQIWAANGSNEVMQQLLQAFGGPGRTALSFAPTYSMYPEYARNTMTNWVQGHRDSAFKLDLSHAAELIAAENPAVVLLPSPNNPTGTALTLAEVAKLAELVGAGVLVLDEAYAEFRREGTASALELLADFPNLVVSRTMSKAFALAGARLGYLAASPEICAAIRLVRLPYHLSAVTQATALAALQHAPKLLANVAELRANRDDLVDWLLAQGYQVAESDANFVLFGVIADRNQLWQDLLAEGVLIRETGPAGWLRVSVGTKNEMAAFKAALVKVKK